MEPWSVPRYHSIGVAICPGAELEVDNEPEESPRYCVQESG